jgi:hypothetical protein
MKNLLLSLFVILSGQLAIADGKIEPKIPSDVNSLISRIQGCRHFSGEEPYNEERKAEIAKAMEKLSCDSLDKDTVKIKKKYKKSPAIIKVIEAEENGEG